MHIIPESFMVESMKYAQAASEIAGGMCVGSALSCFVALCFPEQNQVKFWCSQCKP